MKKNQEIDWGEAHEGGEGSGECSVLGSQVKEGFSEEGEMNYVESHREVKSDENW